MPPKVAAFFGLLMERYKRFLQASHAAGYSIPLGDPRNSRNSLAKSIESWADAFGELSREETVLINEFYVKNKPMRLVCLEMGVSRATAFRIRDSLARRIYERIYAQKKEASDLAR